jgi:7,8-didemethyl-8-hydroxy-5-deazariboflavin synthase CofH subunit
MMVVADLERLLETAGVRVRSTLGRALEGHELHWEECLPLCRVHGPELLALIATADELRRRQAGERASYVINRNVNFTNVCAKACKFCAFSRTHRSEEGYFLDTEEVVRRVVEAHEVGATEVCIQAGLPPGVDGRIYIDLCRAVKKAVPSIHVHAFSPEEIKYGAELSGWSIRAYIEALRDEGLGSIPGTSAEILDDSVRKRLAGGRITTSEWTDVIRTAHSLGMPTTSTIMFGHIETDAEMLRHLDTLRSIQLETRGFTEFVPLSFIHGEAPLYSKRLLPDVRPGPTGNEVVRLFAIARLLLGESFVNIQASWVKEGIRQAQLLLSCGANDLGGTLINESISTSAGAAHGQRMRPAELRRVIRDAGRVPVQRDTLYRPLQVHPRDLDPRATDALDALDRVEDGDDRFGSYAALTKDDRYRFKRGLPLA